MHRLIHILALCLALIAIPALRQPALAQVPEAAIAKFLTDRFADTEAGIEILATEAPNGAVAILEALAERRLFAHAGTKRLYFKDRAGKSFDASSGAPADIPTDAIALRLNNRLRSSVQSALGGLTLLSPDAATRAGAAEAVFRSRNIERLPALRQAIAAEKDARVLRILRQAEAAITLADKQASEERRMSATEILVDRGGAEVLALFNQVAADASPNLRVALDRGIAAIERARQWREVGQTLWFGLSLGSVLLLAAIGLAITFGVMGIINMAHGEMVMLGAYTTFLVQEVIRAKAPGWLDWSLPIAVPLAFFVAGAIGIAIERGVIRFLYGRPLETLLATFGISLILQQAVRTAFGPTNRDVSAPSYMAGAFEVMGLQITYGRLWIVIFTLAVFVCLLALLKATPLGLQMRAVTQNRRMAAAMGIRTRFVDSMTFGLGSGIAGVAGVALSQIDNVSPNLGQSYIIDSFMVVVFGGVGNLWGTLISAFSLGIANKLLEPYAGAVLGKIAILVLLILFIQKRPRGLFALKGRAVDQ